MAETPFKCMVEGCNEGCLHHLLFGCCDEHQRKAVEWLEQQGKLYQEAVDAGELDEVKT